MIPLERTNIPLPSSGLCGDGQNSTNVIHKHHKCLPRELNKDKKMNYAIGNGLRDLGVKNRITNSTCIIKKQNARLPSSSMGYRTELRDAICPNQANVGPSSSCRKVTRHRPSFLLVLHRQIHSSPRSLARLQILSLHRPHPPLLCWRIWRHILNGSISI